MVSQGRVVRSWTKDIMGLYLRIYHNMAARDPGHNSNHIIFMGCLYGASLKEQLRYFG